MTTNRESMTIAEGPDAEARQNARRTPPDLAMDRMYRAALAKAGCEVITTPTGWIATSPAGHMWGVSRAR